MHAALRFESKLTTAFWTGGVLMLLVSLASLMGGPACNMQPGHDDDHNHSAGEVAFTTAHATTGGESLSCAHCHGADGSGGPDDDIRGSSSSHLQSHAQGTGTHPDGVKFPDLTEADFDAMAEFLGGEHSDGHDDEIDNLVGDAANGAELFRAPLHTANGVDLACSNCHRQDGAGAGGPSVQNQAAGHLMEHAQGTGEHPDGIKYPELTPQDFADMAAFLNTSD